MSEMTDFDPYQHLLELTEFCNQADRHISQLIKNQDVMRKTINQLRKELTEAQLKLELMEIANDIIKD